MLYFLATFHSLVNAKYSDISVDCNHFQTGFCRTFRNNIILQGWLNELGSWII